MDEKETIAGVFDRAAATYDRVGPHIFSHFGRRLVELANLQSGEKVLDVAAGRGGVLFPAAEYVGEQGRVVGIDISAAMVKETTADIRLRDLKNVEMLQMDGEELKFPDAAFDYLLSGFSLFSFPQLDRALSEFRRVLKPGGKIAVSTWGKEDERWTWYEELLRVYQPERKDSIQKIRAPVFTTLEGMQTIMTNARFANIQVVVEQGDFVYANEEEWWSRQWSSGSRRPLEQFPPEALEKFKADVFEKIRANNKQQDGVHTLRRVLCTLATKPHD